MKRLKPHSFKGTVLLEICFSTVKQIAIPKGFLAIANKRMDLNQEKAGAGGGGGDRTCGHPSLVAAPTKDAMLKIESTNIHTEMVSRNSTKIDGIPPLKGP